MLGALLPAPADGHPLARGSGGAVPDGAVQLDKRTGTWRLHGRPARLELCVKSTVSTGVLASTLQCQQWGSAQEWLDRRYPGQHVVLVDWRLGNGWQQYIQREWLELYYRINP